MKYETKTALKQYFKAIGKGLLWGIGGGLLGLCFGLPALGSIIGLVGGEYSYYKGYKDMGKQYKTLAKKYYDKDPIKASDKFGLEKVLAD